MQFLVHNIWTKFAGTLEEEIQLNEFLSVLDPERWHSTFFRTKKWDGYHRFYNKTRRSFPTGLLNFVLARYEKHNIIPTVHDLREKPQPRGKNFNLVEFTPRDYQLQAAEMAVERGRAVIHAATNSGKTEIAAMIINKLQLPTLYIVHTNELMIQTKKRFESRGLNGVALLGGGRDEEGMIQVAMVQTLYRYRHSDRVQELLKGSNVIFIDECQHTSADSYYKLLMDCNSYYRFGLSGTPFTKTVHNDFKLIGATGSVLPIKIDNQFLIQEGHSAIPYVIMVEPTTTYTYLKPRTYAGVYDLFIKNNEGRNKSIAESAQSLVSKGRQVLIIVKQIDHGNRVMKACEGMNFLADFVHGSCDYEFRTEAIERFKRKEIDVLVASTIFDEGIDVPAINAVILAVGEKSPIKLLQRIGRGLRKKENNYLTIVDFDDNAHPFVIKHAKERKAIYAQQGFKMFQGKEFLDQLDTIENDELRNVGITL